jgi:hypothetical protein
VKIIRVFPRRTKATPDDEDVRVAVAPGMFDEADEIHIPVLFTYDLPTAEKLARQWESIAPVKVGGPACGDPGGDFVPGLYVKKGYVMTSRGCPNHCWFCLVPKREGTIRELPLTEGFNLLDSNILATSDGHINAVFKMLAAGKRKYKKPVEFTGGLEAARLKQWHVEALRKLRPKQLFFAYDTLDDLEPLMQAGIMLRAVGFTATSHCLRCYVLCGFKGDTISAANKRMEQTIAAGFMPMAMVFRDTSGKRVLEWVKWGRLWSRPSIIHKKMREVSA